MQNKVIDFRSNPEGYLIPFEEGKALASFTETEAEARRWMERNKYYLQMGFPIVVLGIGAGIHLQMIYQETNVPVYVVDNRLSLMSWAQRIFKATTLHFIGVDNSEEIVDHPVLQEHLGYVLPVVFEPGVGSNQKLFSEIKEHLLGRSDQVWAQKGLDMNATRHWREWTPDATTLEQRILKEVLA